MPTCLLFPGAEKPVNSRRTHPAELSLNFKRHFAFSTPAHHPYQFREEGM
jgi:hypothetical protein